MSISKRRTPHEIRRQCGLLAGALVFAALWNLNPSAAAAEPAAQEPPVTRILAIGTLTPKATVADRPAVLAREVPATLKLYLAGKIDSWYAKADRTGVVFLLNVKTVREAQALLDPLPLGQAGMMTFEYMPLGPLQPLGLLLRQDAK